MTRVSPREEAEWVCAVIDYLVLDERPASLEEYVSKPTLARKAKVKVAALAELAEPGRACECRKGARCLACMERDGLTGPQPK